jgi:BirA family biotin operon repressor/biotin-[acetyl-CoA-carboxylase] ligase
LRERGDTLLHFASIDSTMDEARRRFRSGESGRIWIVADRQEQGRGRSGRSWVSPPGNLHLTLLTSVRTPLRDQPKLGFAAGVALAEAAASVLPADVRATLKWPNDLLLNGAKASGVLLEGLGQGEFIAIGIGVNVTAHPPSLPYAATHLQAFDARIGRAALFEALATRLAAGLDLFAAHGFAPIRARWLGRAADLGGRITVGRDGAKLVGRFLDIDADGRLLLETDAGVRPIDAGDVFPLDNPNREGQGLHVPA